MTGGGLTIRASLLGIIGFLNLLLAGIAAYNMLLSVQTLRHAGFYRETTTVMNNLISFSNSLSMERGAAISSIYAQPQEFTERIEEARRHRADADSAFEASLEKLAASVPARQQLQKLRVAIKELDEFRARLENYTSPPRDGLFADDMLRSYNNVVTNVDLLATKFGGKALSENPAGARRLRFARAVWTIGEFSGRQYALLGRIIAENKYPTEGQQRDLLIWQGRIEYAWDLAYGFLETDVWGQSQRPFLDEANTQFAMTFEQIKSIFTYRASQAEPQYPLTAEMWLDMAAQAQDSLHSLTASAIQLNRIFIDQQAAEAWRAITFNVIVLFFAFVLSLYSWHVIERRVLAPIRFMIDTMYRAARGESYDLPSVAYGSDEIGKLGDTLLVLQENARQLAAERDRANSANMAKSEFLASMSHEIRTPMNVVLGITSILQMVGPPTEKQKQLLDTQQRSGEALLSLLNDLLDVSKIETHGFQLEHIPFRLDKLVEETVSILSVKAREKGLTLETDISAIAGKGFIGDPTRLKQILTNLCGNAVKFTARGKVTVSSRSTPSASEGIDEVFITVTDTGVGIAADKLEKIFDKFTQADSSVSRHYGGSGLGLAIARAFVEMMQGTLTVKSTLGHGSSFTVHIRLPVQSFHEVQRRDDEAGRIPAAIANDQGRHRVLLVEDYAPNALVAETFLSQLGFRHDVAESGAQAIEKLRASHYDVVLMDIQMPGMDGYEATRIIRQEEKDTGRSRVRIIGLTAHATFSDRDKCFAVGMDDYLAKPYRIEDLREKIMDQIAR